MLDKRLSTAEDIPLLVEWLLDPIVLLGFPMSDRKEVEHASKIWISYTYYKSCFTFLHEGNPVGIAALCINGYQKLSKQALLSIIVAPDCRGKGFGTLMMRELKRAAKEDFGIELLHLEVYDKNPAIRLYQREGFHIYGVHPRFMKEQDGSYSDKILMQIRL